MAEGLIKSGYWRKCPGKSEVVNQRAESLKIKIVEGEQVLMIGSQAAVLDQEQFAPEEGTFAIV